jgi:hypothetical protein
MAISVAVFVGSAHDWLPELVERASNLKVNGGFEAGADLYVVVFFFYHPVGLNTSKWPIDFTRGEGTGRAPYWLC